MNKINYIIFFLLSSLLACTTSPPSENDINTAIANTQNAQPSSTSTIEPSHTPTLEPTATATPTPIKVAIQVTSYIKLWEFLCLYQAPCNLMQITWRVGSTVNSCTTAGNKGECQIPFSEGYMAQEGDIIQITLESRNKDMDATCQIRINQKLVSESNIKGIGTTVCEASVSQ